MGVVDADLTRRDQVVLGVDLGGGRTDLLRTQYPELFAVIGDKCGGNGTTTFGLPDTIGRMSRGSTVANRCQKAGQDQVLQTVDMLAQHQYPVVDNIPLQY